MSKERDELSNIQDESVIIGTLICHPDFAAHSEYLLSEYFQSEDNRVYYWAIQELAKDGIQNIDACNLESKIRNAPWARETLDKYNLPGISESIELYKLNARHTLEEYKTYVDSLLSYAFKRELSDALGTMQQQCSDKNVGLDELNQAVYGRLDQLTEKYLYRGEVHLLGEELDDIWDEIVERRNDGHGYGIRSKFDSFSEFFTYEPGELVVVQAKTKQGKSALLLNEVVDKLEKGIPTLVVDTEMRAPIYVSRLLALLTRIDINRIKSGEYTQEEAEKIERAKEWVKAQQFVYIYNPNMTMMQLYSTCKVLKRKIGLGFVVYDYMKCNAGDTGTTYNLLGSMCDFLKNRIAGELNLPVLSAAQLGRNGTIADSIKINNYCSVGIMWGYKTQEMMEHDGGQAFGNTWAKVYINRLGESQPEDDEDAHIDFNFSGRNMVIEEAMQHNTENPFE